MGGEVHPHYKGSGIRDSNNGGGDLPGELPGEVAPQLKVSEAGSGGSGDPPGSLGVPGSRIYATLVLRPLKMWTC